MLWLSSSSQACTAETKAPFKDQTKTGPLGWIRVLNLTASSTKADVDCAQHAAQCLHLQFGEERWKKNNVGRTVLRHFLQASLTHWRDGFQCCRGQGDGSLSFPGWAGQQITSSCQPGRGEVFHWHTRQNTQNWCAPCTLLRRILTNTHTHMHLCIHEHRHDTHRILCQGGPDGEGGKRCPVSAREKKKMEVKEKTR